MSMTQQAGIDLVRALLRQIGGEASSSTRTGEVPSAHYTSQERFERERAAIFARLPALVAHESELAEPGACLTVDVAGVPLLVVRGADGEIRAFRNACRHRSTRLVTAEAPCRKKAIVCPYHGWTYDLAGTRIHAPHAESFRGKDAERQALVPAHAAVRHGFVWVGLEAFDAATHLSPIDDELGAIGTSRATLYRRATREVRGNWKLILDAFLDGYHIRHLHRDTVYPFFVDAMSEAQRAGDHIRAATARRTLLGARDVRLEDVDLRTLATPSYVVFPNTVLILHPDYTSVLTMTPVAPDRTTFVHMMLIPQAPRTEAEEAHWAKSFALIDEGVFLREDLAVVEAMQRGIAAGADQALLFGELEHPALWFHESLARAMARVV
jgi:glycine betaine catabolism A